VLCLYVHACLTSVYAINALSAVLRIVNVEQDMVTIPFSLDVLRQTTNTDSRQDNVSISVATNVFGPTFSCLHQLGN
jgi:hypothetical protein